MEERSRSTSRRRYSRFDTEGSDREIRSRSRERGSRLRERRSRSSTRSRSSPRVLEQGEGGSLSQLLNKQQEYVYDLINQHKEKIDDLLVEKNRNFRSKGLEKQYIFNKKIITKAKKLKKNLKKEKVSRALSCVRDLIELCEEHADDLMIADSSRHGWLTVHQLRGPERLPGDLQKKVEKIDSRLDKVKNGGQENRRYNGGRQNYKRVDKEDVQTYRYRRQGPEEAIQSLSKTQRNGSCTHCRTEGHYFKECPQFWTEVAESRKKAAPATN